ncbi:MAG: intracellular growth attenuator family protein [Candidatus Competibacteraceae bacterium]|nr:intracellular growth attenuator family protein [Candidatus Competibacteraceae bacterium]
MTYADIINLTIFGGIVAFLLFLLIDVWFIHRRFRREQKSIEDARRAYEQIVADTFRPKQ